IYWAALTLGPLLMGASLALTSYLAAIPFFSTDLAEGAVVGLINFMPLLVALAGFTLLFMIVPNRRVRWHHALIGAALSAVLFELASRGFVLYVSNFPTYERLYGALAAVPIFLVWIYLSWVVVLLGASLSAALTTFNYEGADWHWPKRQELFLALRLLGHFWQMQRRGKSLSIAELQRREPAATDLQLRRLLGHFEEAGFIQCDHEGDWLLSADLDEISLMELYRAGQFILPIGELPQLPVESHWDRALYNELSPVDSQAGDVMQCSIKSLLTFECSLKEKA
ncbi:MAG: YihY family inner membrane protein, partial [Wenzhouxiangella sp.]